MAEKDSRDLLVVGTTNVPYRVRIDAETLAECIRSGKFDDWVVHVANCFTDVRPGLVIEFARRHGISIERLAETYRAVRDETAERSWDLEAELEKLGVKVPDRPRRIE